MRTSTSATCSHARSTICSARHVGLVRISELSMGVMGRTPDYMNVTFAGFADDRSALGGRRRQQRRGLREPRRVPEAAAPRRPVADAHDRAPDRRQGDRQASSPTTRCRCTRSARPTTRSSSAAPGCWPRWRRSPTSRPSIRARRCLLDLRPSTRCRSPWRWTRRVWCSCAATARRARTPIRSTRRSPPGSTSRMRSASSTTCDVPKRNVFIDGNIDVYNSVMGLSSVVAEHHAADHHPRPDEAGVRLRAGREDGRGRQRRVGTDAGDARRAVRATSS